MFCSRKTGFLAAALACASAGRALAQKPAASAPQTPAQHIYGVPVNPNINTTSDLSLSQPLTLNRAIQIALTRQNAIAIALAQEDAGKAGVVIARSNYFPQITPGLTYQTSTQTLRGFGSSAGATPSAPTSSTTESLSGQITAKELIWDTGKREATLQQSRNNLFASEFNLGNVRQDVVLNVTQSYYQVLRDRQLIQVQQVNVQLAQETLDSIEAQVKVGNAAQSDTLQAQSNLANAQVALLQAENQAGIDEATLKNNMGVVSMEPLVFANQQLPTVNPAADTRPVISYIQMAYNNRLDLRQQQALVDAQTDSLRIARINAGLSVNASVQEGYQFDPAGSEQRLFLVSFSYPLFDAGLTRAEVRSNQASLVEQERGLDQQEQNIRLNVEQDYLTREVSRQQVTAADSAVAAGQTNYQAAKAKLENGVINILDSINAEVQLVTAQVNQVNAIYNFYIADARLLRDIGSNDPAFVPDVPRVKLAPRTSSRRK